MSRLAKQILFGGIYVLIFALATWGVYGLFVTTPTCTDGIQNSDEEGVDCGAVCGKSCPPPVHALQNLPIQLIHNAGGTWDALAHIENPNSAYGASKIDYTLRVQAGAGASFAVRRGSTYANPLQPRYLVFPLGILTTDPTSASLQFNPADVQWGALAIDAAGSVTFPVRSESFTSTSTNAQYEATITNHSSFNFDSVDIAVLLYDSGGTIIGSGGTVINTLLSEEVRGITVQWPFSISGVARTETFVGTNLFANDNYLKTYGSQERFQGY